MAASKSSPKVCQVPRQNCDRGFVFFFVFFRRVLVYLCALGMTTAKTRAREQASNLTIFIQTSILLLHLGGSISVTISYIYIFLKKCFRLSSLGSLVYHQLLESAVSSSAVFFHPLGPRVRCVRARGPRPLAPHLSPTPTHPSLPPLSTPSGTILQVKSERTESKATRPGKEGRKEGRKGSYAEEDWPFPPPPLSPSFLL